uniref:Integrase catalytic domain-containing protein n=1 Tax=Opuntia streptacantha TaxID=393608 RepID=A0A7C8ZX12_OPUST
MRKRDQIRVKIESNEGLIGAHLDILTLDKKRYFLLFVDDYTRMMWVYFLEQKSQAFSYFLQFKALTEKQSGHNLKFSELIVEENSTGRNLTISAKSMASKGNYQ